MPFLGMLARPSSSLIQGFHCRFQLLNFTLPYFRGKRGVRGGAANFATLTAAKLPFTKARRSLNLSLDQAPNVWQNLAGRLANPASQHAKIAAVIAQKLQNIVSDSLRALAQKQLLQKGENFALMRQRASVVGIKVKPGHNKSEAFSASSSPRKTAGLWRRFAVSLQIYLSGAQYRAKVRTPRARPRLLPHRKAKRAAINNIRYI